MTPSPYTHAIIAHAHKPSIPLWSILRNQTYYIILYYIIIFLSYCSCHVTTSTICLPPSPSFPIFGLGARVFWNLWLWLSKSRVKVLKWHFIMWVGDCYGVNCKVRVAICWWWRRMVIIGHWSRVVFGVCWFCEQH